MIMEDEEIWKPYPEFEWVQGSNLGNVRTLDHYVARKNGSKYFAKGHMLPQQRNRDGYMRVQLNVNGKTVSRKTHRIVASCFLKNPKHLPEVNHKNCDRTDNRVKNLEWCTHQENIAYRDKLGHTNYKDNAPKSPVIAINLKTYEASRFPSQNGAARQLGADHGHINDVLKGRQKTTHGYWFTYDNEDAVEKTRMKFDNEVAEKVKELMEEN